MKRIFLSALFAPCLLLAADRWNLNQHVHIEGDYLYMARTHIEYLPLIKDGNNVIYTSKDLNHALGFSSGFRGVLSVSIDKTSALEATYSIVPAWNASHTATASATLSFPFYDGATASDFTGASTAQEDYSTHFFTPELNYWYNVTPRRVDYFSFAWTVGARYASVRERFDAYFTKGANTSSYDIKTRNYITCLQLGANLQMNPVKWCSWDVSLKGGFGWNRGYTSTFLGNNNNATTLRSFRVMGDHGSLIGQVQANFQFHWLSFLDLQVGYQAYYLWGLALAPEQINFGSTGPAQIDMNGDIFYYGLVAGFVLRF